MTTPRVPPVPLLAILLMACMAGLGSKASAADPVLRFPDGITWKGIFDSGFRPKHVSRLEHRTCESKEQAFVFQLGDHSEKLDLDRGLLTFELKADNGIRMIWHQSRVPVSMNEGERRLEQFRRIMKGHITQEGQMPVMLDEATATVLIERHFDVGAIVGNYSFIYGFDPSFTKGTPLIPHFYIVWRETMDTSLPIRKKEVTPPEGYEWYSLDPKIDTPAPGIRRPMSETGSLAVAERPRPGAQKKRLETQEAADPSGFNSLWMIAVIGGALIVAAIAITRRFRKA